MISKGEMHKRLNASSSYREWHGDHEIADQVYDMVSHSISVNDDLPEDDILLILEALELDMEDSIKSLHYANSVGRTRKSELLNHRIFRLEELEKKLTNTEKRTQ